VDDPCTLPHQLDGELPYVVTCPPMDAFVKDDDCIFVLAQHTPYNSWAQTLVA
jgi:hypothetical protein